MNCTYFSISRHLSTKWHSLYSKYWWSWWTYNSTMFSDAAPSVQSLTCEKMQYARYFLPCAYNTCTVGAREFIWICMRKNILLIVWTHRIIFVRTEYLHELIEILVNFLKIKFLMNLSFAYKEFYFPRW